jgi:hypothetical protein
LLPTLSRICAIASEPKLGRAKADIIPIIEINIPVNITMLVLIMSVDALMDCDLLYNIFHP